MATAQTPEFFDNFDDESYYPSFEAAITKESTLNFAIEFDDGSAHVALDLQADNMSKFLSKSRASGASTRWINLFGPNLQTQIVKAIAEKYEFTPRLAGIMRSRQLTPEVVTSLGSTVVKVPSENTDSVATGASPLASHISDPEKNDHDPSPLMDSAEALDLSHYKLIDEVWHYCSVDWGEKYLCIGYNSLPNLEASEKIASVPDGMTSKHHDKHPQLNFHSGNLPMGKRVWTWLIICDDGTVISMFEDPFPSSRDTEHDKELKVIRRNLINVVRQLSSVKNEWRAKNAILTLDIRPNLVSNQSRKLRIQDSPGLLFYYLFDDWYTSYALVAKKEQQYAVHLERLRKYLFDRPSIELIQSLHQTGRQLAVLKRIYEGYALIITRILDKQYLHRKTLQQRSASRILARNAQSFDLGDSTRTLEAQSREDDLSIPMGLIGIPLSEPVIARFERLLDRIRLYALSEIQECLGEKEDLVFLNFNLITLKESFAVEKLTRITILLAKATILFLPVSLMTGYFSVQIQDLEGVYTHKTYWATFAVVFFLSFLFLLVFGLISGTLEGTVVYQPMRQMIWDAGKGVYGITKTKRKMK